LIFGGDIDRIYPPVFGIVAGSLVIFGFWNRLSRIELRGFFRTAVIGTLVGIAAGAVLGAAVYPPLRQGLGPKANLFSPAEAGDMDRAVGVFLGLGVGVILGAIAGALSYLMRLRGHLNQVRPAEPLHPRGPIAGA